MEYRNFKTFSDGRKIVYSYVLTYRRFAQLDYQLELATFRNKFYILQVT